jgi:hypothetical protein
LLQEKSVQQRHARNAAFFIIFILDVSGGKNKK